MPFTSNLISAGRFVDNINFFFSLDWEKHAHTPCVQIHKVIDKYSMIADGLSTLSNTMRNVRENYQATKRTMQQGVDNLANDVRYTGRLKMKASFFARDGPSPKLKGATCTEGAENYRE